MPRAPLPCFRKTARTPHAHAEFRVCIWHGVHARYTCLISKLCDYRAFVSRMTNKLARILSVLDVVGWKNKFKHTEQAAVTAKRRLFLVTSVTPKKIRTPVGGEVSKASLFNSYIPGTPYEVYILRSILLYSIPQHAEQAESSC